MFQSGDFEMFGILPELTLWWIYQQKTFIYLPTKNIYDLVQWKFFKNILISVHVFKSKSRKKVLEKSRRLASKFMEYLLWP